MKELKFRAYGKNNNKMIYFGLFPKITEEFVLGGLLAKLLYGTNSKGEENTLFLEGQGCVEDVIYMQYTGLKDRKGNEIYANDIITDGIAVFRVYDVPGGFAVKGGKWINDLNDLTQSDDLILEALSHPQNAGWIAAFRIIGNIYEGHKL